MISFVPSDTSVELHYESVIITNNKVLYRGQISTPDGSFVLAELVTGTSILLEGVQDSYDVFSWELFQLP